MAGDRAARNEQVVSPCQTVTPAGGGNHTALTTERPACEPKSNMWPPCKQSLSTKGTVRPLSVSGSNTWLPRFPRVWSAVLPLAESATGLMLEIHSVCFMLFSYMCLWVCRVHFTATFFFLFSVSGLCGAKVLALLPCQCTINCISIKEQVPAEGDSRLSSSTSRWVIERRVLCLNGPFPLLPALRPFFFYFILFLCWRTHAHIRPGKCTHIISWAACWNLIVKDLR